MSVQNILNPATGQISNAYIDVAGLGVVTNPLTSNLDGQTAYGLTDANVVSTGTLQTDSIEAYATLPGAPIAILSNVKFQTPAKQLGFEDAVGANVIYSLSDLRVDATNVELRPTTEAKIIHPGEARLVMFESGGGGYSVLKQNAGSTVLESEQVVRIVGEAPHSSAVSAQWEGSGVAVRAGNDAPRVSAAAGSDTYVASLHADSGVQRAQVELTTQAGPTMTMSANKTTSTNSITANGAKLDITTTGGDIELVPSSGIVKATLTGGQELKIDGPSSELYTNLYKMRVNSGIVEGVEIGYDGSSENFVQGFGLPLRICESAGTSGNGNIVIDTGGVGGFTGITATAAGGIQFMTPSLVFNDPALQSNTSSGNSGEHLVITLNGVQYKIKLELP